MHQINSASSARVCTFCFLIKVIFLCIFFYFKIVLVFIRKKMTTAKRILIQATVSYMQLHRNHPRNHINCKILDKIVAPAGPRRRVELNIWNSDDAESVIWRGCERRRRHIVARARLIRCHDVRRRPVLSIAPRRSSHARIQNLVVVVIW